ncbi:MAG: S8 family serine peptidase, partial [Deltaproteobacteria bacterium]|nr:S8 family serine peptidase [Deltaproteobacteria bacterium]
MMKLVTLKVEATIVLLTLVLALPESVFSEGLGRSGYVPGEILVKFRSGVSRSSARATLNVDGFRLLRRFRRVQVDHVKIPDGWSVEEAIAAYRHHPDVEYVAPNYIRRATDTVPDDFDSRLWGLSKIECPAAWDIHTGDSNVVVAVLDSGADLDHADLSQNIWKNTGEDWDGDTPTNDGEDNDGNGKIDDYYGWDFVNNDNDPDDDYVGVYHGTHVSCTIGAVGDNGTGITGVNWSVSIMVLKMLSSTGRGDTSDEIAAIEYAIDNGADIISASFSGGCYSNPHNDPEREAIDTAEAAGVLFVAAAGNDGRDLDLDPVCPAGHDLPNIIAVAATDDNDTLASFSNYGATSVDVAAPGVSIYSTKAGDSYQYLNGTSMATPHVSGLAALIWAENPGFTYNDVKDRILDGVDVVSGLTGLILNAGRINANNSINLPASVPDDPSLLEAEASSASRIDLSWTDNASNESGFRIERGTTSGGPYTYL